MNSIILTHVAASTPGEFLLDAALDRLGAWLDAEMGSLEDLLDISGHGDAEGDIKILRGYISRPHLRRRTLVKCSSVLKYRSNA